MKWINAEQKVTVTVYDEEHEEHHDKIMTVEEMLDTYTNEGCPTIYSNPERKTGRWITWKWYIDEAKDSWTEEYKCSTCGYKFGELEWHYCPNCGAKMGV